MIIFRILDGPCRIQIFQIIYRVKTRIHGIVAIVGVGNVRKPETFFIQLQVNITAHRIGVFFAGLVGGHYFGDKPAFNLVSGRANRPGVFRRIHPHRMPVYQVRLHHALRHTAAGLERIELAILVIVDLRVVIATVDSAKVHVYAVGKRFSRPVQHHGRNLQGRANSQATRELFAEPGAATGQRVGVNPDRIVKSHHGIQRNRGPETVALAHGSFQAVVIQPEGLLKVNIPAFRMLVIGALVPAASIRLGGIVRIRSHRSHLDGIIFHNQRGRHVVPRAHQANHLGLRRSELQIKPAFARSIEPALVDTQREQRRRLRALGIRKIHHLGPFVLTAVNIEQGRRGTPICGLDCRRSKIVVVPVRVRILLSRDGIVQDVIADGNIHRTVAEAGVGSPGVVDVQHVGRIETGPETPYGIGNLRRRRRSVYKNRAVAVQMRAQVQHAFCRCGHVGSPVPHKKSRL